MKKKTEKINEMELNSVPCESTGCPHLEMNRCTHRCVIAAYQNGKNQVMINHRIPPNKQKTVVNTAKALATLSPENTFSLHELKNAPNLTTLDESTIDAIFHGMYINGMIFMKIKREKIEYWKFLSDDDHETL
jgi:hypothetical protein